MLQPGLIAALFYQETYWPWLPCVSQKSCAIRRQVGHLISALHDNLAPNTCNCFFADTVFGHIKIYCWYKEWPLKWWTVLHCQAESNVSLQLNPGSQFSVSLWSALTWGQCKGAEWERTDIKLLSDSSSFALQTVSPWKLKKMMRNVSASCTVLKYPFVWSETDSLDCPTKGQNCTHVYSFLFTCKRLRHWAGCQGFCCLMDNVGVFLQLICSLLGFGLIHCSELWWGDIQLCLHLQNSLKSEWWRSQGLQL